MATPTREMLEKLGWKEINIPFVSFPPFVIGGFAGGVVRPGRRDVIVIPSWRNRPCSPDTAQMRDDIERAREAYEPKPKRFDIVITSKAIDYSYKGVRS